MAKANQGLQRVGRVASSVQFRPSTSPTPAPAAAAGIRSFLGGIVAPVITAIIPGELDDILIDQLFGGARPHDMRGGFRRDQWLVRTRCFQRTTWRTFFG